MASFGYNEVKINKAIADAKAAAAATSDAAEKKKFEDAATALEAIKPQLTKDIKTMQDSVAAIDAKVVTMKAATSKLSTAMLSSRDRITPLIASAKTLVETGTSCGFVKDIYDSM